MRIQLSLMGNPSLEPVFLTGLSYRFIFSPFTTLSPLAEYLGGTNDE